MKELLLVNANVNRKNSRTQRLTKAFLRELAKREEFHTTELILESMHLAPLSSSSLNRRYALIEAGDTEADEFVLARQWRDADIIVISTPLWLFTYPARLKAYLEAVDVIGVAYDFNEDGSIKTDVGVLLKVKQISCYGNDSYGGMSGRDIMALATGLYESCDFNYMDERVKQVEYLADGFYKAGIKGVVLPAGGHAVYINMDEFFDHKRGHETFAGDGFSLELIRRYGIRVAELGDYSMEYDLKTPEQQAEVANVVRFCIDRSRITREHLDYVIAAVKALYEDRESIPNMRIVWGHNLPMRHFHAFLEPYPNEEK